MLAPVGGDRLLAHGAEQRDQLLGQEVVADGADALGAVEQHRDGRPQAHERIADPDLDTGLGEPLEDGPVLSADRHDERAEIEEGGDGVLVVDHRVGFGDKSVEQVHHHGLEQVGFGREVPEDRADRDTGPRGDVLGRGGGALLGEHGLGRLQDARAIAAGIGAQRSLSGRRGFVSAHGRILLAKVSETHYIRNRVPLILLQEVHHGAVDDREPDRDLPADAGGGHARGGRDASSGRTAGRGRRRRDAVLPAGDAAS
jgi:hypothetical protein